MLLKVLRTGSKGEKNEKCFQHFFGQEAKSEKCPRKVKTERGLYMKRSRSFGKGLVAGIVIWLFIILADAIDEFVLDVDSFLGINGSLVVLLCMIVAYIVYYIKKKPHWKNILCFFTGYLITGAATGWIIWSALENETFFIEQTRERCDFFCLNGIEYLLYPFITIGAFSVLCALFHVVYAIISLLCPCNKKDHVL